MQQLYSAASKMDLTFDLPDLSSALREIQCQYDSIAAKNLQVWCLKLQLYSHLGAQKSATMFGFAQEMDSWYRTKFQDLSNASAKHVQSVRSLREEVAGYKKDVSTGFTPRSWLIL